MRKAWKTLIVFVLALTLAVGAAGVLAADGELPELKFSWFGDDGSWGLRTQFTADSDTTENGKYYNIKGDALNDLADHIVCSNGKKIVGVKQLSGPHYVYYFDKAPVKGEIITFLKGMKYYNYTGTANGATHEVNDDGEFVAVSELKSNVSYKLNDYWESTTEEAVKIEATDIASVFPIDGDTKSVGILFNCNSADITDVNFIFSAEKVTEYASYVSIANNTLSSVKSSNFQNLIFTFTKDIAATDALEIKKGLTLYDFEGEITEGVPGEGVYIGKYSYMDDAKYIQYGGKWERYVEVDKTAPDLQLEHYFWFGAEAGWTGMRVQIDKAPADSGKYYNLQGEALRDTLSFIEYRATNNAPREVVGIKIFTQQHFVFTFDKFEFNVGDTFTMKAGLPMYGYDGTASGSHMIDYKGKFFQVYTMKNDIKFLYTGIETGWVEFNAEEHEITGMEITGKEEADNFKMSVGSILEIPVTVAPGTAYATPELISSDTGIIEVVDGKLLGKGTGTATVTAKVNSFTDTVSITVAAASPMKGVKVYNDRVFYVFKGASLNITLLKGAVEFENGLTGVVFALTSSNTTVALDTSETGEKEATLTIAYDGGSYTAKARVMVYDYVDQEIAGVGIADWFDSLLFVQFDKTNSNFANYTDKSLQNVLNHIEYYRADGTQVTIADFYVLGANVVIFPLKAEDGSYDYREGDRLIVKAGLPLYYWTGDVDPQRSPLPGTGDLIIEGYLQEDHEYRYSLGLWDFFKEYTDITNGGNKQVVIGKTVDSGIIRVPSNATSGTIAYTSSDPDIATVSAMGVVTGKKEGKVTITAVLDGGTAGEKTTTIEVTVVDGIVGLKFNKDELSVKYGAEFPMSQLSANLLWASGKTGDAVSLSGAAIKNFDSKKAGTTQTVTITVTVDGVEYSGTVKVAVGEQGCGSCSSTFAVLPAMFALLAAAIFIKKR